MSMFEMMSDAGIDLFFFAFGLVSGVFLSWIDEYKRAKQ